MRITKCVDKLYLLSMLGWCAVIYVVWFQLSCDPSYFDRHWISFAKFYSMGRIVISSDRQRLYDPYVQRERLAEFVKPTVLPPIQIMDGQPAFPSGFSEHPPHFFMLYTPFSFLKPLYALWLYTAVCWLLGVAGLLLLTKVAKTLSVAQTIALAIGATACFPSRFALMLGQPAWLMVGLYGAYMALWLKRNERLAGIILALLTIKPQYPIFFAIPSFVARRWQLLMWAFLVGCLLLLVSVLTVGLHNILSYVPMISRFNSMIAFTTDDAGMPSLRGLVCNLFGAAAGIKAGFVGAILALIFVSLIWWRTDKDGKDPRWAFAITVLSILVFSPHIFKYDALFLVLVPALTLDSLSLFCLRSKQNGNPPGKGPIDKAFVLWRYLLITYPLTSILVQSRYGNGEVATIFEFCINLLLLLLAVRLWSSRTSTAETL